jgi:hypothetical protein
MLRSAILPGDNKIMEYSGIDLSSGLSLFISFSRSLDDSPSGR